MLKKSHRIFLLLSSICICMHTTYAVSVSEVKTHIEQVQQDSGVSYEIKSNIESQGGEVKGLMGNIIANIFDTSGRIKNDFISAFQDIGTGLANNVLRWDGDKFVEGSITDDGTKISIDGNVGIGTTSPSNKLHVSGNIGAAGWIGAGCEGSCESGGGYALMYANGEIVNTGNTRTSGYIRANTMYTPNWFRSTGSTGWYSETYGGGIYMQDSTWVRAYNNRSFYTSNKMRADNGFDVDAKNVISNDGSVHTANYPNNSRYGYFEGRRGDTKRGFFLGRGNGSSTVNLHLDAANRLDVTGGSIYTPNTMQAAIFRDNDNSSYYVDPSGVSYVNRMYAHDIRPSIIYDRNDTRYYLDPNGTSNVNRMYANDIRPSIIHDKNNPSYYLNPDSVSRLNDIRPNIIYDGNDTRYYLDPNGTSNVNRMYANDFRAGIIYDRNNPSYYLNPDSVSRVNQVRANKLDVSGDIYARAFLYSSDRRLKENIAPYKNDIIQSIQPVRYTWKKSGRTDIGVIAQEVQKVLPEAVVEREDGYLAVDYTKLIIPLIRAVHIQEKKIQDLESQIKLLMK